MRTVSRRQLLKTGGIVTASGIAVGVTLPNLANKVFAQAAPTEKVTNPDVALRLLVEGNSRFQKGDLQHPDQTLERRTLVAQKQQPFSIVFACADSRESPEIIFDYGLGDLFVVRTAGHVLDAASLGSIEYGIAELKIPLLVVLGHERCGAVKATIETLEKNAKAPGFIGSLVQSIQPATVGVTG